MKTSYSSLVLTTIFSFLSIFIFSSSTAEELSPFSEKRIVPPEEIEKELTAAEKEFQIAKEMFNPWYAGPLLTPSAHTLAPGYINIQPYLFVIDNYASFDKNRHSKSQPDLVQVQPLSSFQAGLTSFMDCVITLQGYYNMQSGIDSGGFGDVPVQVGFALAKETPYIPAIAIKFTESFPAGKYDELSPNKRGLDGVGSGSYISTFSFNIGKVIWWVPLHPMSLRLSLNCSLSSNVTVKDISVYGGGIGTRGTVKPGVSYAADFGFEYSFTQKWVLALDVAYTYKNRTTFCGNAGVDEQGSPFKVGAPSSDQLSLAPAIEYNPYPTLGFIGGVWFSVYGRNTSNFIGGILSCTYAFPVTSKN